MNSEDPQKAVPQRSQLRAPQFGLGGLLILVSVLCVLFAVMRAAGPFAAFSLTLLVLAVIAHVAGTAIGKRLREVGSVNARLDSDQEREHQQLNQEHYAPVTRLGRRHALGWSVIIITTGGAVVGGGGGAILFLSIYWQHVTVFSLACGVLAMAALGGFFAFLCAGFFQVAANALTQASSKH